MKNKYVTPGKLMLMIALVITGTSVFAQPGFGYRTDSLFAQRMGWNVYRGLDLSEEQETKIVALRDAYQQEMTDIRNDLNIKRAELQKLRSAENPDLTQINKKLDEIGQLTTELSKKAIKYEQDVLNVLTDEQKKIYRSGPYRRSSGYGYMGRSYDFGRGERGFDRFPAMPFRGMRRGR
ncbi:MAG: Spy/CpxP family protein refolding chaperone [Bacteroidales bacterium]|nr:Spy/CpxP family protein refolding chaperone [Bacteroidales bacterium]